MAALARAASNAVVDDDGKIAAALNRKHTEAMVEQLIVVAADEVYSDVVFYDASLGSGIDGPKCLASDRREVLLEVARGAPRLAAMLERRHPDLAAKQ